MRNEIVHLEVEIADDRPIMAAVCGGGKKVLISEINYGPVVAISSHWPIIAAWRKNGRIHRLNLEYVAVGMPIEMREDSTRLLKVWKYSPWSRRRRALASTEGQPTWLRWWRTHFRPAGWVTRGRMPPCCFNGITPSTRPPAWAWPISSASSLALVKETCLTRPAPCMAVIFSFLKMPRPDVITLET